MNTNFLGEPGQMGTIRVHVYSLNRFGAYYEIASLLPPFGFPDTYGFATSLALSGDGLVALIGAPRALLAVDPLNNPTGLIWKFPLSIFDSSDFGKRMDPYLPNFNSFGQCIGINRDGTRAIVGAYCAVGNQVFAYKKIASGQWIDADYGIYPPSDTIQSFGIQVALSGDGLTAAVVSAEPYMTTVYRRFLNNDTWFVAFEPIVIAETVSLSSINAIVLNDNGTMYSFSATVDVSYEEVVYNYKLSGSQWVLLNKIEQGINNLFNSAIAMSSSGIRMALGTSRKISSTLAYSLMLVNDIQKC
jgi:hypothetical protein